MNDRIVELAREALTATKNKLEAQLEEVKRELAALGGRAKKGARAAIGIAPVRKRRKRTAAQRRAQAEKMRAYWAKRKAAKK